MNLTTDDADGKIRLDQYLAAHLPELSRSRIQSLIKSGDAVSYTHLHVPLYDDQRVTEYLKFRARLKGCLLYTSRCV